jgi:hypothetical protein
VFIGEKIPEELLHCSDHIILWNHNLDINTGFVSQNLRMYYPALLDLPPDELVMITDMDMLPMSPNYYCDGLEEFGEKDFIYYRNVDRNQIYMCYNAAHPSVWATVFGIQNEKDILHKIDETYNRSYDGRPSCLGWYKDQEVMYSKLIHYPHLKVLNRPIKRLEIPEFNAHLAKKDTHFIHQYDDSHFHRSYQRNETNILEAEKQLNQ